MNITNKIITWIGVVLVSTSLTACSDSEQSISHKTVLRIGVLPDHGVDELRDRFTPLLAYLKKETGLTTELVIPTSYAELLMLFHEHKVDLAYFGGFTFLKANQQDGAIPLIMRDVDTHFTSKFLVRGGQAGRSLSDYKGKRFSFGSKLSTSGHLMPRYFLIQKGIVAEKYFREVKYSDAHDKTAIWVKEGKVDIGVLNTKISDRMFADGRLDKRSVQVLWETPPYPDYVWALHPKFEQGLKNSLRDSFLKLSKINKRQAHILELMNTDYFLPAGIEDFNKLRKIGADLGLI